MKSLEHLKALLFPLVFISIGENLNYHLKMHAKCIVYIALLSNFTQNDATMIGTIFRRIVPERIFIVDEGDSDTVFPAAEEYMLIKRLNDQGKL